MGKYTRFLQYGILVLLYIWISGCGGKDTESSSSENKSQTLAEEKMQFWQSLKLPEYSYTLTAGCWDCDERFIYRVNHKDGHTVFTEYSNHNFKDSKAYKEKISPLDIEQLFAMVIAEDHTPLTINRVNYDEQYGFPSYIYYSTQFDTVYAISDFSTRHFTLLDEYYQSIEKWLAADVKNYNYVQTTECSCDFPEQFSVNITEENPPEAFFDNEGRELTFVEKSALSLKVEELFNLVFSYYTLGYDLAVTYDAVFGYPLEITINPDSSVAAGRVTIGVNKFIARDLSPLLDAQGMWEAKKPDGYAYTYEKTCTATSCENNSRFRLIWENEELIVPLYVTDVSGFNIGPTYTALSIADMFALVEEATIGHYYKTEVEFDPVLGYPKRIYFDQFEFIEGDEVTYSISEFTGLEDPLNDYYSNYSGVQGAELIPVVFDLSRQADDSLSGDYIVSPGWPGSQPAVYSYDENRVLTQEEAAQIETSFDALFKIIKAGLDDPYSGLVVEYHSPGIPSYIYLPPQGKGGGGLELAVTSWEAPFYPEEEIVMTRNRELFEVSKLTHYSYRYGMNCSVCKEEVVYKVTVEGNDVTVKLETEDSSEVAPGAKTLRQMFDIISMSLRFAFDVQLVEYDPNFGFPTSVEIDPSKDRDGDEVVHRIFDFVDLAAPKGSSDY